MSISVDQQNQRDRLYWMDNLRSFTIFLVVLYHIGGVYEAAGMWSSFWIVDDPTTITWVGIVGIMFDIIVMPLMFFIAGYLVPESIKNRTIKLFLLNKLRRLLLPWLIAVVTLIPMYKFFFLYSRGLPQETWTTYFHIGSENTQNWLWFLPVLFLFNVIYAVLLKSRFRLPSLSIKGGVLLAVSFGFIYSYIIGSWFGFRSWSHSALLDFENERLLIYFMVFLLGALSFQEKLFTQNSPRKLLYNVLNGIAWIPVTSHILLRLYPFIFPEGFSVTPLYRSLWWISFNLSLVAMMFTILGTFWRYFNRSGKFWRMLNQNSYGVYIVHVIVIGFFGTLLMKTGLPALAKYPLLILITYSSSNLIVSGYYYARRFLLKTT